MGNNFRIGIAVVAGAVILGGAFLLRTEPPVDTEAAAVVTNTRGYQNTKDTDGDGMRDWEEELRGTNPLVADKPQKTQREKTSTLRTGSTTELSNAETAQFARSFFEEYIESGGGTMSKPQQSTFVARETAALVNAARDDFYTRADIQTKSGNDLPAFREYGNTIGSIIATHSIQNENELAILERALEKNNADELKKLLPIIAAYEAMITDILHVAAPTQLADKHLDLLNTLNAIHTDIEAMRTSFDDPLPAMVRIKRYQDDATGLYYAIDNLRKKLEQKGVTYTNEEPGIFFFSFR